MMVLMTWLLLRPAWTA